MTRSILPDGARTGTPAPLLEPGIGHATPTLTARETPFHYSLIDRYLTSERSRLSIGLVIAPLSNNRASIQALDKPSTARVTNQFHTKQGGSDGDHQFRSHQIYRIQNSIRLPLLPLSRSVTITSGVQARALTASVRPIRSNYSPNSEDSQQPFRSPPTTNRYE